MILQELSPRNSIKLVNTDFDSDGLHRMFSICDVHLPSYGKAVKEDIQPLVDSVSDTKYNRLEQAALGKELFLDDIQPHSIKNRLMSLCATPTSATETLGFYGSTFGEMGVDCFEIQDWLSNAKSEHANEWSVNRRCVAATLLAVEQQRLSIAPHLKACDESNGSFYHGTCHRSKSKPPPSPPPSVLREAEMKKSIVKSLSHGITIEEDVQNPSHEADLAERIREKLNTSTQGIRAKIHALPDHSSSGSILEKLRHGNVPLNEAPPPPELSAKPNAPLEVKFAKPVVEPSVQPTPRIITKTVIVDGKEVEIHTTSPQISLKSLKKRLLGIKPSCTQLFGTQSADDQRTMHSTCKSSKNAKDCKKRICDQLRTEFDKEDGPLNLNCQDQMTKLLNENPNEDARQQIRDQFSCK